jgi:DNA (cytosine-5)-methyltransferase 1
MPDLYSDYVTIKDAAEMLGVSVNTLRNWGAAKRIDEYRHPVNNYRLYKLTDLKKLRSLLARPTKVRLKDLGHH